LNSCTFYPALLIIAFCKRKKAGNSGETDRRSSKASYGEKETGHGIGATNTSNGQPTALLRSAVACC